MTAPPPAIRAIILDTLRAARRHRRQHGLTPLTLAEELRLVPCLLEALAHELHMTNRFELESSAPDECPDCGAPLTGATDCGYPLYACGGRYEGDPDNDGCGGHDTRGITADAIRRTAAAILPADAEEVRRREIITLTTVQIEALGRYYNDPSPGVVATYAEAVRLCLPPLVAGTRHFESRDPRNGILALPSPSGDGATLTARCTLAQSLRAREAAQWLLGRVEVDHT